MAGSATAQTAAPLAVGTMAPDFSLAGATMDGALATPAKLSDFRGQTVVLAFYPKARTSGCTIQMTSYRDKYSTLFNDGKGVVLLAISVDPVPDLVSWASDEKFPFRLLSDSGGTVGKVYGAYKADWKMNSRTLFVVDPDRQNHLRRRSISGDRPGRVRDIGPGDWEGGGEELGGWLSAVGFRLSLQLQLSVAGGRVAR